MSTGAARRKLRDARIWRAALVEALRWVEALKHKVPPPEQLENGGDCLDQLARYSNGTCDRISERINGLIIRGPPKK